MEMGGNVFKICNRVPPYNSVPKSRWSVSGVSSVPCDPNYARLSVRCFETVGNAF